ncbi:cardiolipin synthase [Bacillus sp. VT 712]|uniref:Cardiolipin synthase n=2 Tax=Priestia TaxID=2800373 RepID=A0A0V8JGL8_9BACI|nr:MULTISPECIES: cardiolipin synthase [Bacillaceae]KSU86090.1 cardiolipin synthase [Priestia veravalensis]KZB92018.1 cardiolipin synthase [Bacillus sp. VT 712]MBN8251142.1 cardiolipin synthase [Priestia flexa]MBY6086609.1 cardiolipin synthase [Priestia flexa]MED4587229.1 cardiolipin synthase [Priestia flexa]
MKNRLQLLVFIAGLVVVLVLTKEYLSGQIIGILSLLITISVIFIGLVISLENRHPTQTLTWLVVLGSFPVVGFFFYLLFGRNIRKRRLFAKKAKLDEQVLLKMERDSSIFDEQVERFGEKRKQLLTLATQLGKAPVSFASDTRALTNGDETFDEILEALQHARHHIHMEYYIVRHDDLGQKIKDILIEKVQEGIYVRFLYDAVGSFKLSKHYIHEMREAGVEMVPFLPVRLPLLNNKINFRNHRKIVVIDGTIGFVGGLNIGDEYLGQSRHFGFWRDTHLQVRGEAVRSLQLIFLQDWYYMTGQTLLTQTYLSPDLIDVDEESCGGVQMIAGGPDREWEVIKHLFFSMITSARESIWIASPYFIPDEDIFTALKVAALSGVDVRLLVPKKPDKKIVFHASRSYFPELLAAGVKVYEYEKGFMHSKIVIVDKEIASIGTANMDMRSFHLNFEVNAFLYKTASTQKLVYEYMQDLEVSSSLHLDQFQKRPILQRVFESTSRLLSPLL